MSLAHDEAISLGPLWLARPDSYHSAEEKCGQNIGRGKISSRVSDPRVVRHRHRANSQPLGGLGKFSTVKWSPINTRNMAKRVHW